jgi:hypothetical protein
MNKEMRLGDVNKVANMKDEITTTDLAEFGMRELGEAADLLKAYTYRGLEGFYHDEVRIMFNKNSGLVFLTNSDFQVAMLSGDKLELFYSCPQCGHEGFLEDMEHNEDDKDCQEYLTQIKGVK